MKVLLLTDTLESGGAERQLALLARHLPSDWERRVWSLGGGPFVDVIRSAGVEVELCERVNRLDVRPAVSLWRSMAAWRPTVVHSWGWLSSLAAGPACKVLHIPLVDGTVRAGIVPPDRGRVSLLGMNLATHVVANSHAGLLAYGVGPGKGTVVPNGFDSDRLALCTRANRSPDGVRVVVMVGRMVKERDYGAFFAAARKLLRTDGTGWRFVAVGEGPDRARLIHENEDLIELGVASFPEPTIEVLPVVREADIGVLMASREIHAEGCSNAIMEYMACSLPVVCSQGGGNRELVVDGVTGFLVPTADHRELADRLMFLQSHPGAATSMGAAGRTRLLKEYSVENMVRRTAAAYMRVINSE